MSTCRDGQGRRCPNEATHTITYRGDPKWGSQMCREHAAEVVEEYRPRLGADGLNWAMTPLHGLADKRG